MLSADRIAGALILVKAVDVAVRGPVDLPAPLWVAVLSLWVVGGTGLLAGRGGPKTARGCWALVLCGGAGIAFDYPLELRRHHLVLLMAVALGALVARDDHERLLLWRVQLSTLYGIAALAKVNESFLGGDVLARGVVAAPLWSSLLAPPPLPLLLLAGIALIATEALLAVTPWVRRLRRPGTAVAAGFHLVALLLASTSPLVALRLVVFGGTAVLLHAVSAGLVAPSGRSEAGVDCRRIATVCASPECTINPRSRQAGGQTTSDERRRPARAARPRPPWRREPDAGPAPRASR